MDIAAQLKEYYFKAEDKYYSFIEKTPLVNLVDRVDKVVPSFPLLLGIVLLVLIGIIWLLAAGPATSTLTVMVYDDLGNVVANASVQADFLGESQTEFTDELGRAQFNVPLGATVSLNATKEG